MALDRNKFRNVVHYICWTCNDDPSRLGAVKLNKALWLADFTNYYRHGEPITGARYVKQPFGPVPTAILPTIAELEQEGVLLVGSSNYHGYPKKDFKAIQAPRVGELTDEEKQVVDSAVRFVCDQNTAKSISDLSHDHIWQTAEVGEELPYFTVFARAGDLSEDEIEWARTTIDELAA